MSAKDRLMAKATKKTTETTEKKDKREVILVDNPEMALVIDRLCSSANVKKSMEGHEKVSKATFQEYGLDICYKKWIDKGTIQENPKFQSPNGSSFNFQIRDTICGPRGFRVPYDEDGNPVNMQEFLAKENVPEELIGALIENNEFEEKQVMSIPISTLEEKNPDLAEKLFQLILLASEDGVKSSKNSKKTIKFDDEELKQILSYSTQVKLKEGLLSRLIVYCRETGKENAYKFFRKITSIFSPQITFGQTSIGNKHEEILSGMLSNTEESHTTTKRKESVDLGEFTANVDDKVINIMRKKDNQKVATKECADNDHVNNTLNKWKRFPDNLSKYILDNM